MVNAAEEARRSAQAALTEADWQEQRASAEAIYGERQDREPDSPACCVGHLNLKSMATDRLPPAVSLVHQASTASPQLLGCIVARGMLQGHCLAN